VFFLSRDFEATVEKAPHFFTLFFILFPWVSFGLNSMDTQPYYIIILAAYAVFTISRSKPIWVWLPFFTFILSILMGLAFGNIDFFFARSVIGYLSLFLVCNYFYEMKKQGKNFYKPVLVSCMIMFVVAIIQAVVDQNIFDFLVHVRTQGGRGVTSLTPEPTYFAIYIIFASFILLVEKRADNFKSFNYMMLCNAISLLFLSKSSMGVLFVILALVFFAFSNVKRGMLLFLTCIFGVFLLLNMFDGSGTSRMEHLANIALDDPSDLLLDASVNDRVKHLVYPVQIFISDYAMPHGFHGFEDASSLLDVTYNYFFSTIWTSYSGKIMSGFGSVLFELGFFGLPMVLWLGYFCVYSYVDRGRMWICLSILLYMFTAIPIAFTLFPMLVTIMMMNHKLDKAAREEAS